MSSCGAKNVWLKLGSSVTMHNDSSSVAAHLVIRTFLPTHSNSSPPPPLLIVAPTAYAKAWLADIHITGDDLEPPDPAPETYLAYPPTLKQHVLYTSRMTTYCASRDEYAKSRGDSEHSMDQLAQCCMTRGRQRDGRVGRLGQWARC